MRPTAAEAVCTVCLRSLGIIYPRTVVSARTSNQNVFVVFVAKRIEHFSRQISVIRTTMPNAGELLDKNFIPPAARGFRLVMAVLFGCSFRIVGSWLLSVASGIPCIDRSVVGDC